MLEDLLYTRIGHQEGLVHVHRAQDVEPILDYCHELRQTGQGKSASGEVWHVGEIPYAVAEDYCNTVGITFDVFMSEPIHIKRIMNDPAYSKFRVIQGRV